MTVRANKPFFNIREKIKELDFFRLPYQKMPPGSVVQVLFNQSNTANNQTTVPANTEHLAIPDTLFTPKLPGSKILIFGSINFWYQHSSNATMYGFPRIKRNGVGYKDAQAAEHIVGSVIEMGWKASYDFIDETPYTLGETITYTGYWFHTQPNNLSNMQINRATTARGSSITIMEIAQ